MEFLDIRFLPVSLVFVVINFTSHVDLLDIPLIEVDHLVCLQYILCFAFCHSIFLPLNRIIFFDPGDPRIFPHSITM